MKKIKTKTTPTTHDAIPSLQVSICSTPLGFKNHEFSIHVEGFTKGLRCFPSLKSWSKPSVLAFILVGSYRFAVHEL